MPIVGALVDQAVDGLSDLVVGLFGSGQSSPELTNEDIQNRNKWLVDFQNKNPNAPLDIQEYIQKNYLADPSEKNFREWRSKFLNYYHNNYDEQGNLIGAVTVTGQPNPNPKNSSGLGGVAVPVGIVLALLFGVIG